MAYCKDCGAEVFIMVEDSHGVIESHRRGQSQQWLDAWSSREYCYIRQICYLQRQIDEFMARKKKIL